MTNSVNAHFFATLLSSCRFGKTSARSMELINNSECRIPKLLSTGCVTTQTASKPIRSRSASFFVAPLPERAISSARHAEKLDCERIKSGTKKRVSLTKRRVCSRQRTRNDFISLPPTWSSLAVRARTRAQSHDCATKQKTLANTHYSK